MSTEDPKTFNVGHGRFDPYPPGSDPRGAVTGKPIVLVPERLSLAERDLVETVLGFYRRNKARMPGELVAAVAEVDRLRGDT